VNCPSLGTTRATPASLYQGKLRLWTAGGDVYSGFAYCDVRLRGSGLPAAVAVAGDLREDRERALFGGAGQLFCV
jgi:hypothetical protein